MDKKKAVIRALPVCLVIFVLILLMFMRKGTGDIRVITVKLLWEGQVEKAYELNTPERKLGEALQEIPDGQDFGGVKEIYVNGVQTQTPLEELEVTEGDCFELVFDSSQLPKEV